MSDAPLLVQVVVTVVGMAFLVAAGWAKFRLKDRPADRDYRDDL
jgi:hypothetical protein